MNTITIVSVSVVMYMLPTIIAIARRYKNIKPILTINIFFGWTVIVWFALMSLVIFNKSYNDYKNKQK